MYGSLLLSKLSRGRLSALDLEKRFLSYLYLNIASVRPVSLLLYFNRLATGV